MAVEIAMPQMGLTMEAGTILHWLKRVGEPVRRDEPLLEIETDKAAVEVASDAEGVLLAILVPEGTEVPVGTLLGWIGREGEEIPAVSMAPAAAAPGRAAAPESPSVDAPAPGAPGPAGRPRATPAARARARAAGVLLAAVQGTGPAGRIQARDVAAAPAAGAYRDLPVAGMRRAIAERLTRSFHGGVPVLLTTEVVVDRARALVEDAGFRARCGGRAGYLPLVVKAAGLALRGHPQMNAHWLDHAIRRFETIDIGIAVSLDEGLVVPVLHGADRLDLAEIAGGVAALAERARQGTLRPADVEGGTFTISNLGAYRIGVFMPVINPPQVAILGVGRVVEKPAVRDGQVLVLPVLPLSLVFDHRAVDGAPAAAFLEAIGSALEAPEALA